jgi:hypothetical protein
VAADGPAVVSRASLLAPQPHPPPGEVEYPEFVEIMTTTLAKLEHKKEEEGGSAPPVPFALLATAYKWVSAVGRITGQRGPTALVRCDQPAVRHATSRCEPWPSRSSLAFGRGFPSNAHLLAAISLSATLLLVFLARRKRIMEGLISGDRDMLAQVRQGLGRPRRTRMRGALTVGASDRRRGGTRERSNARLARA